MSTQPVFANCLNNPAFQAGKFNARTIFENADGKVVLAYFEPGQFIPVHAPNVNVTLVVMEGEGWAVAGNEKRPVSRGDVVVVPRGERRGVLAQTRMIIVHTVAPLPGPRDHDEVKAKLLQGRFE